MPSFRFVVSCLLFLLPGAEAQQVVFEKTIAADQMAFLNQFAGMPSDKLIRDKQFRKLMHSFVPDCTFHYGHDMPLTEALEFAIKGSGEPVQIREDRYLLGSGRSGPWLGGRGFVWIDLQDGIGLGGFYFRPTNGEPTPTVNIFSRQVKEVSLKMSQLPPAFAEDVSHWSVESRTPQVTTRYLITGANKKIVLEHDEDYCAPAAGTIALPQNNCQQINADAADIDLNAAYYVEQTHHATNATAWMITGADQLAWVRVRDTTCGSGAEPLRCRIIMTRQRTAVILSRP